jgi:hypothetical protein
MSPWVMRLLLVIFLVMFAVPWLPSPWWQIAQEVQVALVGVVFWLLWRKKVKS